MDQSPLILYMGDAALNPNRGSIKGFILHYSQLRPKGAQWVECESPNKICPCRNPQKLWVWPYLGTTSLQMELRSECQDQSSVFWGLADAGDDGRLRTEPHGFGTRIPHHLTLSRAAHLLDLDLKNLISFLYSTLKLHMQALFFASPLLLSTSHIS